jgi:hypothetical protein
MLAERAVIGLDEPAMRNVIRARQPDLLVKVPAMTARK